MIEPLLDVHEIQGHSLRGFDTQALFLLGLKMDNAVLARAWLSALSWRVDTLSAVHQYRLTRSFAPVRAPRAMLNVALSAYALIQFGYDLANIEDGFFLQPMGSSAAALGDPVDASASPDNYVLGKTWNDTPDILLIIGADTADEARTLTSRLKDAAAMAGCVSIYEEAGGKLPGEIEHFGFRDGISQLGPRGRLSPIADDFLTLRFLDPSEPSASLMAKPGKPLVWPGQFVFGYPTHLPASPLEPGPDSDAGVPWMKNGSYLVFRRLRQDVPAFRTFISAQASALSADLGRHVSDHEAGAMIVGRWRDGSPLPVAPARPEPGLAQDEMLVNHFNYGEDAPAIKVVTGPGQTRVVPAQPGDHLGLRCPHFAHVRKVNPRDLPTDQGIAGRTLTFQMLRRGIPYGHAMDDQQPDTSDRGLLFLAYQTSFKRQFALLTTQWVDNSSAPELTDEGHDLLISQNSGNARFATLRDAAGKPRATITTNTRWVVSTGGGFFFAPSVSFLRAL